MSTGAQSRPRQVRVLIAAPGGAPLTWFGHVALVIDQPNGDRAVYHYGSFARDPETVRGAITGHPLARMRVTTLQGALAEFQASGRTVELLGIALTAPQVHDLVRRLDADVRGIGRTGYEYDVMHDGCATRIRDLLDAVLAGAVRTQGATRAAPSFRSTAVGYIRRASVTGALLADALTNDRLDVGFTDFDQGAFPRELGVLLERTRVPAGASSMSLVSKRETVYRGPRAITPPPRPPGALSLFGASSALALLLLLVVRRTGGAVPDTRRLRLLGAVSALLALVIGAVGAVIAATWLFTAYPFAPFNENLLLLNPLALLLVVPGIALAAGAGWPIRVLQIGWVVLAMVAVIAVLLKTAPAFDQDNWRIIAIAVPPLLALASSKLPGALGVRTHANLRQRSVALPTIRPTA